MSETWTISQDTSGTTFWILRNPEGIIVATSLTRSEAHDLCRAVNSHKELLEACQQVIANLREIERTGVATVRRDQMIVVLDAAIAKATSND